METEARLARLERRIRQVLVLSLLSYVAIGGVALRGGGDAPPSAPAPGASAASPVENAGEPARRLVSAEPAQDPVAQALRLVDEQGRTRAALRMEDGEPRLVFLDATGKERLVVGVRDGAATLALADGAGNPWVDLAAYAAGGCTLSLEDRARKRQLYLAVWDDGVTRLSFGHGDKSVLDIWDDDDGLSVSGLPD